MIGYGDIVVFVYYSSIYGEIERENSSSEITSFF